MNDKAIPKYKKIAIWVKQYIKEKGLQPGDKVISENQLCNHFSVSRQTIRQAIALLEEEGIVTRVQGSGTYVKELSAFHPEKKATFNIGVMTTYLDDYIFPQIICGVERVLSENHYNMVLRLTRNKVQNERAQLLSLLETGIDGLIVEGTKTALPSPNLDIYRQFQERHIPVIFMNAYYPDFPCHYVINDDVLGARLATRHLLASGHDNIFGIFKYDDQQGHQRYKGFMDEMYAQQRTVDDQRLLWYSTENEKEIFSPNYLEELLAKLAGCTAVICYNDQIAVNLIRLLVEAGMVVPAELSVVSFDNTGIAEYSPVPLTSVTHPSQEIGQMAAHSILELIKGEALKVEHIFKPKLVERQSVRKRV